MQIRRNLASWQPWEGAGLRYLFSQPVQAEQGLASDAGTNNT